MRRLVETVRVALLLCAGHGAHGEHPLEPQANVDVLEFLWIGRRDE